ncbi:hypothetical protein JI752_012125 [Lysobacter sp. MMG2]|uniref:hypothetical protein n=1 Tax=Lysobacter sp. MMG2 TaxID=2801338 RepID=UPI001C227E46|nr:hypothetical protein [Lysobacter sp. MMG2]MBU8976891.1 hypothetical protein [Lysobacter sp. MMG2]
MDANRSNPAQSCNPQVESLRLALEWLDREGGQQRNARVLRELIEATVTALSRGDAPPEKDTTTLRDLLQQLDGDKDGAWSKPFRAKELANWWDARAEQLRQVCSVRGCGWTPKLVVKTGGGRGLPSRLSFEFHPSGEAEPEAGTTTPESNAILVRYQMDPAKPAWWLRLLVGSRPFPVQSWRGYVLLGTAALNIVLIGLIWLGIYASWSRDQPITTAAVAQLAAALLVTAGLWWLSEPIRQLPTQRVTMAGPSFLALSELYGQLRTMPATGRNLKSREFAVVRHWATCPICSAEVDLDSGRSAFPDRLIGRCHDAPLEHVFSFDPVRLVGLPLRRDAHRGVGEPSGDQKNET